MSMGSFPCSILQVFLGFLGKPSRRLGHCGSERPIRLISDLPEVLEAVVLHRLMAQLVKSLVGCQYAYMRERGSEHHLLELADILTEMLSSRRFAYIASVDVVGAFASGPRKKLMETVDAFGVNTFTSLYHPKWLAVRVLVYPSAPLSVSPQVAVGISPGARLFTPGGRFYSPWRCLSRGHPQGGVLCPILWLLHFNP